MPGHKSSKLTANIKQLLPTPLEQELYGYAIEKKSVLLSGKDSVDRRSRLSMINWIINGSIETFVKVDCGGKDGQTVVDELTKVTDNDESSGTYRSLLRSVGILFIDNLTCYENDLRDYEPLAVEIEKSRTVWNSDVDKVVKLNQWLVVYVYDKEAFPQRFLDQFERVQLDGSGSEVKRQKTKTKKQGNLDDVKLEMNVEWKGSYSKSHYAVSVKCKNPLGEFKLSFRFMPVLYLLVKGVNDSSSFVSNSVLKKAYRDIDDAKKEIIKSFQNVIGSRAKTMIKITWGEGKELRIPKKNIVLNDNAPF